MNLPLFFKVYLYCFDAYGMMTQYKHNLLIMMTTDPKEIDQILRGIIKKHIGPLQIRKDEESVFEAAGTIPTMQGKQKVDGFYFASVMPKPKDVRLYFFPIYTDAQNFEYIAPTLRKCLKGKSCFHIKKLDESLQEEITEMIATGVKIYQEKKLLITE